MGDSFFIFGIFQWADFLRQAWGLLAHSFFLPSSPTSLLDSIQNKNISGICVFSNFSFHSFIFETFIFHLFSKLFRHFSFLHFFLTCLKAAVEGEQGGCRWMDVWHLFSGSEAGRRRDPGGGEAVGVKGVGLGQEDGNNGL